MSEQFEPKVTEAIRGVWATHQGMQEDQVISVLHEAVKAVDGHLTEEQYRHIGFEIANGTWQ